MNEIIIDGTRKEVLALVEAAHRTDKERLLKKIARFIEEQSTFLYKAIPRGLNPGQHEKYRDIISAAQKEQAAIQAALGILGPDGLLDDPNFRECIDKSKMLERLGRWPDQIYLMKAAATECAKKFKHEKDITYVAIFGLGGSGAPHDIAAEIIGNWRKSSVKIDVIHADAPNPENIDEHTLAIFCSFSGDTEETINCYREIEHKKPMCVVLTKGGALGALAGKPDIPIIHIQLPTDPDDPAYVIQPRESVCLQLTAILTFLAEIGLKEGSEGRLRPRDLAFDDEGIIPKIKQWRELFAPEVLYKDNPAKQLAFFLLYGIDYSGEGELDEFKLWRKKIPCILVDRNNRAIGHEVRTQLHERSKINAIFYEAPEFLHNLVESIRADLESSTSKDKLEENRHVYYFVRSSYEEPRIRFRLDKMIELVIKEHECHAELNAELGGENPLEQALFAVYFNAHMSTYLAMLNGHDPLPVPTMSWLKNVMSDCQRGGQEEREAIGKERPLLSINSRRCE